MIKEASETQFRKATEEEFNTLVEQDFADVEAFLIDADVVKEGKTLFAVVEGVAYSLEELAAKRNFT